MRQDEPSSGVCTYAAAKPGRVAKPFYRWNVVRQSLPDELMSDTEVALGALAAASALYGFVLAYHVFARQLHVQERENLYRVYEGSHKRTPGASLDKFLLGQIELHRRQGWLDLFLVGATVVFAVSAIANTVFLLLSYAAVQMPLLVSLGLLFFLALIIGVAGWFSWGIGYRNFQTVRQENWVFIAASWDTLVHETRLRLAQPNGPADDAEVLACAIEVIATIPSSTWVHLEGDMRPENVPYQVAGIIKAGGYLLREEDLQTGLRKRGNRWLGRRFMGWPPAPRSRYNGPRTAAVGVEPGPSNASRGERK